MRAWEPEPGEVTPRNQGKPWAAFKAFRDLGPERTLKAAAAAYYGHPIDTLPEHNYNTVKKWASKFSWHERAQAFDSWVEMTKRSALEEHARAQAADHGRREAAIRERALRLRELALDESEKMLRWPLTEQRVIREGEDGEELVYLFAPAKWSKDTAVRLYHLAVDGSQPEEIEEPEVDLDLSDWTDQEIREWERLYEKLQLTPRRRVD